jgi:hypothetical protein
MTTEQWQAEYDMLMSMTKEERDLHIMEEAVAQEKALLKRMTEGWKHGRSYSMADIREQRKRAQEWLRRLNALKQKQ